MTAGTRVSRAGRRERGLRLFAVGLVTLSVASAGVVAGPGGAAADEPTGSAVTVSGSGPFADLRISVSRTAALRNEVVQVSWTGGRPTQGNFAVDYLQIMQCWGDAGTGPDREQCQFGGLTGDTRGGAQVASRQVTYDIVDPLEPLTPTESRPLRYVPFRSVTGKTVEAGLSEFFDATTTNEVPFAATRPDGGGIVPFEVQTAIEAPGLGCGAPRTAEPAAEPAPEPATTAATATAALSVPVPTTGSGPRSCWLVVVPRGDVEVDGSRRTSTSTGALLSSPLSASNWQHRVVVPLTFAPVGQPCPIGRAERAVVGHENVLEAVSSWQPTLCADGGPVFSFSQVPDAVARRQAAGDAGGLSVTGRPPGADELPEGRPAVLAPLALSGLTVAFNIESQSAFSAPAEVKARDGQRIRSLDLTPRLVAKLLTQSYRAGAANPDRPGIGRNPLDLTRDPEFLRANPAFAALRFVSIPSIVVPAGLSDGGGLLWQWLLADPEAKAFLAGAPDEHGMVVNPAYKGISAQDGFPKSDTDCQSFLTSQPPLCTLDAFPYAGDAHEAARAAARGDTLARSIYDPSTVPPSYRKTVPQPTGARAVLALTDTATAIRYGLDAARLRNASGAFVAPDDAGLLAGLAAMKAGSDGGLLPDPTTRSAAAYPLSMLSYATTLPDALTADARSEYAALLRHAAGPGQQPGLEIGQLPPGYAPLPASLRQVTLAAAARMVSTPAPVATDPAPAAPSSTGPAAPVDPGPAVVGSDGFLVGSTLPEGVLDTGLLPSVDEVLPAPAPQAAAAPVQATPIAFAGRTPRAPVGPVRWALPVVLVAGGTAALAGAALRQGSARRSTRGGRS